MRRTTSYQFVIQYDAPLLPANVLFTIGRSTRTARKSPRFRARSQRSGNRKAPSAKHG